MRRERAKRTRKHEKGAIFALLFVLSGEVGKLGKWREFYRKKNNNKIYIERKAESNGVIKFFEVGPRYRNLGFTNKGVLRSSCKSRHGLKPLY